MKHSQEHYKHKKFEPIEIIEEFELGFHLGNAIKYILRADYKDSKIDDVEKAIWYLERELWQLRKDRPMTGLEHNAVDRWENGPDGDGLIL